MAAPPLSYMLSLPVARRCRTWRQSGQGMTGPGTSCVFFPIDGFADPGRGRTPEGRDKPAALVRELGCQVKTGLLDCGCREMCLSF